MLGHRRPDGDAASRRLKTAAEETAAHLSMVFHRFLSGEAAGPPLTITVNNEQLTSWDPFARAEPMTQALAKQRLPLEHDCRGHSVLVRPFILPNQHHFSTPEAHAHAGGPKRWNRQQGLYIYRRDRLIQSGGWNRLRTLDEHAKLARISIDIPPAADGAFRTDVAKMNVGLPDDLRPQLRVLVAGVVTRAQDTYRQRVRLVPGGETNRGQNRRDGSGFVLGDQWPAIAAVLERELADYPELLDRVLLALINEPPTTGDATAVSAS
ncbi:MAG: hypothetical protein ACXVUE_12665 [Solirubrobacteraceae bacterium]